MKNLSSTAKVYIFSIILLGLVLTVWTARDIVWSNVGIYLLAALGAIAQTLKVEGPNDKTNYNIALFVYGFTFVTLGPAAAIFVMVIGHLAEWIWHKYPWYIQSFNIGAYVIPVYLAGLLFEFVNQGSNVTELYAAIGMVAASLIFVFGNHFLVGWVIKLARGQSFSESGVFAFFTLFLDFTILMMGAITSLIWLLNPYAALLNILPVYLLYKALQVPRLERQVQEMEKRLATSGD